ncbi:MFS transporter [Streptomyces sp. HUAS 31]|uniref:MFS transporter n=1 Tax=Streptomyces TaxID=1883 RepID=UPI002306979A|nr:MFS transporter [Streptomyces sp. HUAS 31]WCD96913.1 MFS transporter [Streptomyces sp. HUAS 31]
MTGGRSLGRRFGWLWAAYAVSSLGTWLAFDAFSLIAVVVLHAGSTEVSLLAASGLAVGAALAVPLGAWVEFRPKRPVMVAADLIRCAALLSLPVAFALDALDLGQLLLVSVAVAAADITFNAASGAYLKSLVPPQDLLVANGRFEATMWTATALGPPLGGAAFGMLGPMATVLANAASFLLSALGIRAIGGEEGQQSRGRGFVARKERQQPHPDAPSGRPRARDLRAGWRHLLAEPTLRPLFLNTVLVNSLIMASAPLLAVLMLGRLGFAPWQYGLAFAVPCLGGLLGSRLSRRLTARHGSHRVLLAAGSLRACWPVGLAFVGPGTPGLLLVMAVEFGLITCAGVFNPVLATSRLELTPPDRVTRTLAAWSISTRTATAATTALWGWLAALTGPRTAIALAGALLLATPLLLPWHEHARRVGALK